MRFWSGFGGIISPKGILVENEIWREFLTDAYPSAPVRVCGICGNTGMIAPGPMKTPAGLAVVPISKPCICPNGRVIAKRQQNLERFLRECESQNRTESSS